MALCFFWYNSLCVCGCVGFHMLGCGFDSLTNFDSGHRLPELPCALCGQNV